MYDPDEARQLLQDELTSPEYQRPYTGPVREAFDAILQWLQDEALSFGPVNLPAGPVVVFVLLLAAITVILAVVRPRLQRAVPREGAVDIAPDLTAEELRARAAGASEDEDYDAAYRDLFRAIVRSAEQRGVLSEADGRTATEIAGWLALLFSEHSRPLNAGAELFNHSRYGNQLLSRHDYERLLALDRQLDAAEPSTGTSRTSGLPLEVPR